MWLKSLQLRQFRNYPELDVSFHDGLNIFVGKNAQGKTNILESIYFLALTRSHRAKSDKELIHFNHSTVSVKGIVQKNTSTIPLDIELTDKGRTTNVNHLKQARLSDYIGHLNVVLFAPEDLQLIKGAPSLRRKFIDVELGQIKPLYLSDLSNYHHVLKQRNSYLKQATSIDEDFLTVLDIQLAEYGSKVILNRIDFLKRLEDYAKKKQFEISNQSEEISIQYRSSVPFTNHVNLVDIFVKSLSINRKRDIFKKNTSIGPHRDDVEFFINGMNAHYGSQGQHRSFILSLKLAELDLMREVTREAPILLLDDVMSELDNYRQVKLLETIADNIQTFITTTSLEHLKGLPKNLKQFTIENGHLMEKEVPFPHN